MAFTWKCNPSVPAAGSTERLLPHGSVVVVQILDFISVGVPVVLVPHGILVHGSIGLGGGVVGRRDAVTGLAAVIAVPVIYGAVWIIVCDKARTEKILSNVYGIKVNTIYLRPGRISIMGANSTLTFIYIYIFRV